MEKQKYKRVIDRIAPEDALIQKTGQLMRDAAARKRPKKGLRLSMAALLALVLLAGVALATGTFESIFTMQIWSFASESEAARYERLAQLAAQDIFQTEIAFEGEDEKLFFSVKEAYYDGESLMLGILWKRPTRPASFDFGPEHPYFDRLDKENGGMIAAHLPESLTYDEYEQYKASLRKDIRCGIIYNEYFMTDAAYEGQISDGLYNGNFFGESRLLLYYPDDEPYSLTPTVASEGKLDDGLSWCYLEYTPPLPESVRDRDEIALTFKVIRQPVFYYADGTGSYCYPGTEADGYQAEIVTVTIRRNGAPVTRYQQDEHWVKADALISPVFVKLIFTIDEPGTPGDTIQDFVQVVDGKEIPPYTSWYAISNGKMYCSYFPPPEGTTEIVFRPVYSKTGTHHDEDIVISLK